MLHNRQDPEERYDLLPSLGFPSISVTFLVAGTSGLKQDSPDPEADAGGIVGGQPAWKWRPDEHRRPQPLQVLIPGRPLADGLKLPIIRRTGADMTRALKKAFEAASKLPEAEQDALAAAILEELESERRWDELFERSADTLAKLAKEALAEDRAGRTRPLDDLL